ncbi:MAG: DUF72 domain-containing protein [Candidatus Wallbacteria bacterium]|nr:DUF72 domain-containing protein [Candidatus Wallbacteria bacterium]
MSLGPDSSLAGPPATASILVGTSGYSYKDWVGPFYPNGTRQDGMLGLYAQRFPAVELNFSYYAIPKPETLARMAECVPPEFRFTLKLHKALTHQRQDAREAVGPFREAMRPLAESGKLACLLAQFPYSFAGSKPNCHFLTWLAEELAGPRLVVEFRHASWDKAEVGPWLARHGIGVASVDAPALEGLPDSVARLADPAIAYVRFHGRNRESWWEHEQAYQRYQYDYSEAELAEWTPRVAELASKAAVVYVFFNNHFGGSSAANAQLFRGMLRQAGLLA